MLARMYKLTIGFTILFMAASGAWANAFSQSDLNWLGKMVSAAHQTDYSGTFIYQSGDYVETSRITHVTDGKNEHEKLEGQDGERSEIIRRNKRVWCYLGERRVMVAERDSMRTFPALLPEQFSSLQENYLISHGAEDRIAGFQAHVILLQPRDKMRYAHKIWAHSDSGLLLKAAVLDEQGHVIEQYAFTQLQIGGDIDRKWIVQNNSADRGPPESDVSKQGMRSAPAESGWKVYALPAGFKKVTEVSRKLRGGKLPVVHLVYSDGLAGISVFVEKLGDRQGVRQGLHSKGVIQVYSKVMDAHLLTVVGEVPPHTIMQVAESVRYGGTPK